MDSIRPFMARLDGASHAARAWLAKVCRIILGLVILPLALANPQAARADDAESPHAHHHASPSHDTVRSVVDYRVPAVRLVRDDGKEIVLSNELDDGRAVVLSFIYTSCTTICPVTSQALAELQKRLGASSGRVHIVSITIDPEQDTPARLRDYARRFGAGPGWQHYTGGLAEIVASEQAFGVYHGDKMSHAPATLLHPSREGPWIRIDGFASPDQLLSELQPVLASK